MECTKVKFSTESYANFHITKRKPEAIEKDLVVRAYKCVYCNSWHITSKVQYNELIKDNEAFREQLVEALKEIIDLKAEIELLKRFKNIKRK